MTSASAIILTCASLVTVDGDTVRCDGELMRDMGPGAPFVSGYDAPEIQRAKCPAEKLLGEQARRRLQELLDQPGTRIEDSGEHDRFGRALVVIRMGNGETAIGASTNHGR